MTVVFAVLAVLIWQLGSLSKTEPRQAVPFIVTILVAEILLSAVGWEYFFAGPGGMSILIAACLSAATVMLLPAPTATYLGLTEFRNANRTYISLLLIGSLFLLVGKGVVAIWSWVRVRLAPPPRLLVLTPEPRLNALWWSQGISNGRRTRQMVADCLVTNATDEPMRIVSAVFRLRRGIIFRTDLTGNAGVKDAQSPYSGDYPIPAKQIAEARLHFMGFVSRPLPTGSLMADVAVVDQYGNQHWTRGLRFRDHEHMLDPQDE